MTILRFSDEDTWQTLEHHLTSGTKERFAFAMCRAVRSPGGRLTLRVVHVTTIDDEDVDGHTDGYGIGDRALDDVHNEAIRTGLIPVEFHNHGLGPPSFSRTDEASLGPTAAYATNVHPAGIYGAAVYAQGRVHADIWIRESDVVVRQPFRSVAVVGDRLRVLNAPPGRPERLARQDPVLGDDGTATLNSARVVIVGGGGTGGQAALACAYIGMQDTAVLDNDSVELTNLNRLVTAVAADIGRSKADVARDRMLAVDPDLHVTVAPAINQAGAEDLWDADLIIGCVDNDGPRDVINQIAVATGTPYVDIATGVDDQTAPPRIGGRVILVRPEGPCLHCLGELDPEEVGRWAKPEDQAELDRVHGYGTAIPDPAVVHLNGIAVNAALGEIVAWIAGHRTPAQMLDVDLTGHLAVPGAPPGTRITPRRPAAPAADCIACGTRRERATHGGDGMNEGTGALRERRPVR